MADPFYGEIRFFGFAYAPYQWAYCNGTQMSIAQNATLYSVIGTRFGGDGQHTYNLPNLQGRVLAGYGNTGAYTPVGHAGGTSTVTLNYSQCPPHQHAVMAAPLSASIVPTPAADSYLAGTPNAYTFNTTDINPWTTTIGLNSNTLGMALGGTNGIAGPHENRQPFLVLNACICLYGEYPIPSN